MMVGVLVLKQVTSDQINISLSQLWSKPDTSGCF